MKGDGKVYIQHRIKTNNRNKNDTSDNTNKTTNDNISDGSSDDGPRRGGRNDYDRFQRIQKHVWYSVELEYCNCARLIISSRLLQTHSELP